MIVKFSFVSINKPYPMHAALMMPITKQEDDDKHHQQQLKPSNKNDATPEFSSPQSQPVYNQKHTLPTEIIVEILLKLSVETLLRCKSVCKSWFSLISEPHFVKAHLNLSAHNNNSGRLIFRNGYGTILNTCCLNDLMAGNIINNGSEVVDFPLKSACREVRVVGSCNGLLCLFMRIMTLDFGYPAILIIIWNPRTRIYYTLPSDGNRSNGYKFPKRYGFGYDESTDDYKVVSVFRETVKMYSLRNGGWKDIGVFPSRKPFGLIFTFLNGALHWAVCDGDPLAIISLDLATETYGEVVMPPVYYESYINLTLGTLGEWLCVLCDYYEVRVDLWAMKVYGVKDSWTKLVSVSYTLSFDRWLAPLCISNDGKIVFTYENKLMIYDSNNDSFSKVRNFDEVVEVASTFFESLVSPLPPASALEHRVAGFNG